MVVPAHAGVIPTVWPKSGKYASSPRTRGGDPDYPCVELLVSV